MRIHRVLAGVVTAMLPCFAPAQQDTLKEIERYRQLLQESNPAELYEARGEDLWKTRRGPKNASLERCDLGLGPGVVKGSYVRLPRYFADTDRVQDAESRLVTCIVTLQGFTIKEAQRAFGTWPGYRVSEGELRSMQWRMWECIRQMRFPELEFASDASIALITYLAKKAEGGTFVAPAIKR